MMDRNILIKNGVKPKRIFVLEKSSNDITFTRRRNRSFVKKLLYLDCDKTPENALKALATFEKIERRQEGWKYKLLINKENYDAVNSKVSNLETSNNFSVILRDSINKISNEISRFGMVIVVSTADESVRLILNSLFTGTPVLTNHNKQLAEYPGIEKCLLITKSEDPAEAAALIMDYSTSVKLETKINDSISQFRDSYSWDNLTKRSLRFLESI